MDNNNSASILLPNIDKNVNYYEEFYPKRDLPGDAIVTRFAQSPIGFVHMESLRIGFIARKIATDSNGMFYLRIEELMIK